MIREDSPGKCRLISALKEERRGQLLPSWEAFLSRCLFFQLEKLVLSHVSLYHLFFITALWSFDEETEAQRSSLFCSCVVSKITVVPHRLRSHANASRSSREVAVPSLSSLPASHFTNLGILYFLSCFLEPVEDPMAFFFPKT